MTASKYIKTSYMKIIFLLFIVSIFASCSRENISTPRVERVSLQWCFYDEAALKSGCDRKGEVLYSLSKKDQEILQSWIRDFVRTAHVDYVTYVPVLVIRGEEFFINILQNKIILNIKTKDGDRWTQISRNRKEVDEEIVNLVMKIIMKVDSPATGVAVGCERICTKKKGKKCTNAKNTKGKGERPGACICKGYLYGTWEFYQWTGSGEKCDAAPCRKCCEDEGSKYSDKPGV